MNKSGVFLVTFLLLLGIAVVPTSPVSSVSTFERTSSMNEAAMATTGTMRIEVAEDVAVVNGTFEDSNFDGDGQLFLGTAYDSEWRLGRSWFKFNMSNLPKEMSVQKATLNVHIHNEWAVADEPIGVYHSSNDTWDVSSITWNNQPTFSGSASDIINSPTSPDMFLPMHWYSWDVTSDVRSSLNAADMYLTEVLKQTVEVGTQNAFKYPSRSVSYPWNATYLEIEYTTPTTSDLAVDGISSGPLLDYINNPTPDVSWTFSDPDFNDFQKDYNVEMWNNEYYNDTLIWNADHEQISVIHDSGDTGGNFHPLGNPEGYRLQMKFPSSELPRSGVVDRLYFTSNDVGDLQIENLEISFLMVAGSAALGTDFAANYEGRTPTIVLSSDLYEVSVVDDILEIDVENTFFVNSFLNLIIEIRLANNTGDTVRLSRTNSGPGSVATNNGNPDASTTSYIEDRTYDLKIGFQTESVKELSSSSALNGFPFGTTDGMSGRFQVKFNQSYVDRAGYLDKMYFKVGSSDLSEEVVYENLTVSLCETPVLGRIDHIDWTSNYGGATPMVVLDESMYTVVNLGQTLVIDFDNAFYYSNTHDLLIDFQWDDKISGVVNLILENGHTSSYRAWDVHWGGDFRLDNGTAGYDLMLDFVNNEESIEIPAAVGLINGTNYYLRARTCDSIGVWGDWTSLDFKYEVITSIPSFSAALASPDPVQVGQEVTASVNVTHILGLNYVYLDFGDAVEHTMTADGDTYSYTWTPTTAGTVNFTIYMQSNANTWADVDGSVVVVEAPGLPPGDTTTLLIIIGGVAVVVIIIVIVMKRKK